MIILDDWGDMDCLLDSSFNELFYHPDSLYESYFKCKSGVSWKEPIQRFGLNLLLNIILTANYIRSGNYMMKPSYEFILNERGHIRYVKALAIVDRIVQRSFNDMVLNPSIDNKLIYDNGASRKGKGVAFSRNRFRDHLHQAYCMYGYDCYILLIDFSKYFDNIIHEEILKQFQPYLTEEEYRFLNLTFHSFDVDVSYLSDDEYYECYNTLFNSLEYAMIDKSLLTNEKIMRKSIGIGNQTSQASGIFYPHEIDNYCTIVRGYGLYGRYMDDTYVIAKTKEELISLLNDVKSICSRLGIHINENKTRIQPIYSDISYLKIIHKVKEFGKVLRILPKPMIKRAKDRIDLYYTLFTKGKMSITDILQCFLSWYYSYYKFDSKRLMRVVYRYFQDKFSIDPNTDLQVLLHELNQKNNEIYKDENWLSPTKYIYI